MAAIEKFRQTSFDRHHIQEHAKPFSKEYFCTRIKEEVDKAVVMLSLSKHDR